MLKSVAIRSYSLRQDLQLWSHSKSVSQRYCMLIGFLAVHLSSFLVCIFYKKQNENKVKSPKRILPSGS